MIIYSPPLKDHKAFDQHEFANNKDKVNFYTVLPSFNILNAVFLQVSTHVYRDTLTLTKFQEFALTLKLKLQSWTNSLGQYSILCFNSVFLTHSGFFCNPLPPIQCCLGKTS